MNTLLLTLQNSLTIQKIIIFSMQFNLESVYDFVFPLSQIIKVETCRNVKFAVM